jgi:broad specificity phosphatase PhoE
VSRAIERRLIAAERRLNPPVPRIREVNLGGPPGSDYDPTLAAGGGMRWERAPGESFAAFRARTRAAAEAAGVAFIVFCGRTDFALL